MTAPRPETTSVPADHTVTRAERPIVAGPNRFKIAIFGANASGGMGGMTKAEGTIRLHEWGEVEALAKRADTIGLEGFIPIARWKSPGGPERTWGRQYESFTWAAGLAAVTERIQIFSTCHVPFVHPVMAAKMCATVDHISAGRMGLNVVAGYHGPEFAMFDAPLMEHDERYVAAAEWLSIMERLWADEGSHEFSFAGEHYTVRGAESYPKPVQDPRPVIMCAGASPAGQAFAFEHADLFFMQTEGVDTAAADIRRVRAEAAAAGREDIALWAMIHIVCKDTEEEARDYVRYYVDEQGDWDLGMTLKEILVGGDCRSNADFRQDAIVDGIVRAGAAIKLVGSPEQIADQLGQLSEAGLDGGAIAMVDYDEGLDRLHEQVLPLVESAGLRAAR
jgi:alkanesulfonate monooxygenase SsuD/methylene tetrahydromethanopterin reductase-like flavin-dependent oxidoreductase (luciferase family)